MIRFLLGLSIFCMLLFSDSQAMACTGILLKTVDGDFFPARTMEWGTFYLDSKLAIVPRGFAFQSELAKGAKGLKWQSKYGFMGIALAGKDLVGEGINEKGLSVGSFYFSNYASYGPYEASKEANGLNIAELPHYLLSMYATVDEVKANIRSLNLMPVTEEIIGIVPPMHWRVVDKQGKCIVIEIVNHGELKIYDAPLGVITNSPGYEWQITNLNNYVNLQPTPANPQEIEGVLQLRPFGVGSGFLGLPGDFTPPSRFVRAAAFSATVPPLKDATAAMNQCFTILDNFNIPIGSVFPKGKAPDLPSSTQWTSVVDLSNMRFYYTTQYNRQIRQVNIEEIDFGAVPYQLHRLDKELKQNIELLSF